MTNLNKPVSFYRPIGINNSAYPLLSTPVVFYEPVTQYSSDNLSIIHPSSNIPTVYFDNPIYDCFSLCTDHTNSSASVYIDGYSYSGGFCSAFYFINNDFVSINIEHYKSSHSVYKYGKFAGKILAIFNAMVLCVIHKITELIIYQKKYNRVTDFFVNGFYNGLESTELRNFYLTILDNGLKVDFSSKDASNSNCFKSLQKRMYIKSY